MLARKELQCPTGMNERRADAHSTSCGPDRDPRCACCCAGSLVAACAKSTEACKVGSTDTACLAISASAESSQNPQARPITSATPCQALPSCAARTCRLPSRGNSEYIAMTCQI